MDHVLDGDPDTWWQAPAEEASFEVVLPAEKMVNRFMIKEAIARRGERVEAHFLEARVAGSWVRVAEGKTIGHKRILRFEPVSADAFRVTITQSRLAPCIAHVSAHFYDEPPKPVEISRGSDGRVTMGAGVTFAWRGQTRPDQSQDIFYTLDGTDPATDSNRYEGPFSLPLGGHLKARVIAEGKKGAISEIRLGILRDGWIARDSRGRQQEPLGVLDGNPRSGWLMDVSDADTASLTIDMLRDYVIGGFLYLPHPPGAFIERFDVLVSRDGRQWEHIHSGRFGNIKNDPGWRTVLFDRQVSARYIRLTHLRAPGGMTRVGAAEIEILAANGN